MTDKYETNLAILHIGMILGVNTKKTRLPLNLKEVNMEIYELFGVEMWNEPNILIARNKLAAIIEKYDNKH